MEPANNEYVNIVSGLPRSGTSMMMRMINEGGVPALIDHVREADEDNPKGYFEFEPVKKTKQDPSWLETAAGKVVKMVYMLLYDLPETHRYRVVFMNRNLEEVIESQDVMLKRRGKDQGQMSPEQLIKNFEAQLEKVYAWLDAQPNFQVLRVDYNLAMKEPAPLVEAVNAFLGGGLDTEAMLRVVDRSLYRRRR